MRRLHPTRCPPINRRQRDCHALSSADRAARRGTAQCSNNASRDGAGIGRLCGIDSAGLVTGVLPARHIIGAEIVLSRARIHRDPWAGRRRRTPSKFKHERGRDGEAKWHEQHDVLNQKLTGHGRRLRWHRLPLAFAFPDVRVVAFWIATVIPIVGLRDCLIWRNRSRRHRILLNIHRRPHGVRDDRVAWIGWIA